MFKICERMGVWSKLRTRNSKLMCVREVLVVCNHSGAKWQVLMIVLSMLLTEQIEKKLERNDDFKGRLEPLPKI